MTDGEIGRSVRSDETGAGPRVSSGERPRLSGGHQRDVAFVALLRAGDPSAFGLLFDTWIDPIYDRISHRSFTTADVAELSAGTFGATHRRLTEQSTADSFRVVLFRAARQDTLAAADRRVDLHMPVGPYAEDRLVRGADAAGLAADPAVAALLWQGAAVLGDQARDVLDLHHRHEFSPVEIASVMNLTTEAVEDILRKVPKGLTAVVRSMVVWRQGAPAHDELAAALAESNSFDTGTVRTIAEHQRTCDECREAGKLSVDPLAVFKAIPLAVAPVGFKEIVVDRLHEEGLPIEGSVSYRPRSGSNGNAATGIAVAGVAGAEAAAAVAPMTDPTPPTDATPSTESLSVEPAEAVQPAPPATDGIDETETETGTGSGAAGLAGAGLAGAGLAGAGLAGAGLAGAGLAGPGATDAAASSTADDADRDDESGSPWDPLIRPASTASSDRDKARAKAAIAATAAAAAAGAAATSAASATEAPATVAGASGGTVGAASPAGSPVGSTVGTGGSAMSAGSGSSSAYKPAPASAPSSVDDEPGSGGNRKLLFASIAVAAVILLIGGFLLTQGGSKTDKSSVSAGPSSTSTSTTTASSSSSIATVTTVPVTGETTPPDTASPDSSVTSTTKAAQTPITIPGQAVTTTTQPPFPNMNGTTMVLSASVVVSAVDPAPTLSWNVVSNEPVTVTITGPGLSSTDMSGGPRAVCPGSIDGDGKCTAPNGVYSYVMKATDSHGRMFFTKTVQFTVKHL